MNEIKRKVTEAINKTGYPVELFVSSIVKKHEHMIWANQYFFDFDANQARSVDIVVPAFMSALSKDELRIGVDLVIECKKSQKTVWVFFEDEDFVQLDYTGQIVDYQQYLNGDYEKNNRLLEYDLNFSLHYGGYGTFSKIAKNYQVIRIGGDDLDESTKQNKTKDTIFEAVNQVVKYITYGIHNADKNIIPIFLENGVYPLFNFHYPIIVYDGLLYNGFLKNNEIELEEREHIVLEYEFKPHYVSKPLTFLIDIVTKNYFEKILETLEEEQKKIRTHLLKNQKEFVIHAKSLTVPSWRRNSGDLSNKS